MKTKICSMTSTMLLNDGRQLGYAEYGDPDGHPVFFFHGTPGSRLQAADFHNAAQAKYCRFFGIDRLGMGLLDKVLLALRASSN